MLGSLPCACGRCLPCLKNRRRVWAHRMMLESRKHGDSCFVTLTYETANLPGGGTLVPKHLQDWLKRLRKAIEPQKIRYYAVGEYGDESGRPHYHAIVFGLNRFVAGGMDGRSGIVASTWGYGHTFVGDLTIKSAQYVAGYVTKKMTVKGDERLHGRYPEFARMSLRPGIGASFVEDVASAIMSNDAVVERMRGSDVPIALRHDKALLPLGRYLRGKLRQAVGVSADGKTPPAALRTYVREELPRLRKEYEALAEGTPFTGQKIMLDSRKQAILNLSAREKVFAPIKKI